MLLRSRFLLSFRVVSYSIGTWAGGDWCSRYPWSVTFSYWFRDYSERASSATRPGPWPRFFWIEVFVYRCLWTTWWGSLGKTSQGPIYSHIFLREPYFARDFMLKFVTHAPATTSDKTCVLNVDIGGSESDRDEAQFSARTVELL